MATIRSLVEGLGEYDLTLETYGRGGECIRRLSGRQLLDAVIVYRGILAVTSEKVAPELAARGTVAPEADGRMLLALLFRSEETIEFLVAAFAGLAQGYTIVPFYPNWSAETQLEYLRRYRLRHLAVGDGFLSRARKWASDLDEIVHVSLDESGSPALGAAGAAKLARGDSQDPGRVFSADLSPERACAWIFTSGTSSAFAKCTEITTTNLEAAIQNIQRLEFLRAGMTLHSPLSASHIFAFVVILGFLAVKPRRVLFSDVQYLGRLGEEKTGKVDGVILVPIVLNRMRSGFYDKLTSPLDRRTAPPELRALARIPLRIRRMLKRLVRWSEDAMILLESGKLRGKLALPAIFLVRRLFGRMFQRRLGRPGFVVVGGAKPNLHAMALLEVMGIPCLQGWGMTETTGPLAVCSLKDRFRGAFGTCGPLFPRTHATVQDGELIVEGPQIARGYVEPDGTLVPFDGRKKTGDSAEFDKSGRLKVLGKVSDRITTDNGINYNPVPFEEAIKAADLNSENVLDEAVVVGDAKAKLGCVFFLREGLTPTRAVESYLGWLIRLHNATRAVDEQIGPWAVSPKSLKDAGCIGPSGKLVRRRVEEEFASIFGEVLV